MTMRERLSQEHGFTMIVTMLVMMVTTLILVAAFTAARGDIWDSHNNVNQKQAYYAALAGIQEYEYQLQNNPDYWESCPKPSGKVPEEPKESFVVTTLAASTDTEKPAVCNTLNPFKSIIESGRTLTNTFRVESVGEVGKEKNKVIATFQVAGFLDYVYFTQYEVADPESYKGGNKECAKYRKERQKLYESSRISCEVAGGAAGAGTIYFVEQDSVHGPMHTDDTAVVCGGTEFGRKSHEPADAVEINGGVETPECGSGSPIYNTASGKPSVGPTLEAPPSDGSLKVYVEKGYEFEGRTALELNGSNNKISVTQWSGGKALAAKEIEWPKNGLIYVAPKAGSSGCAYTSFEQTNTDNSTTFAKEENCGSVYIKGTFKESLTVAGATDVIIDGAIYPYGSAYSATGTTAPPASSPAVIGLIATRFVRVYHPCSGSGPMGGNLGEVSIYAAILSTSHSFLVDNDNCGSSEGNLNVYGAIGQKFRGIVGTSGSRGESTGYLKEYIYDERLATDEPPYYLAPLKSGWRIVRQTAETKG